MASFGYSLFRGGVDSAEHTAWSSRSLYLCYVDVESTNVHVLLGGSTLNIDICVSDDRPGVGFKTGIDVEAQI